MDAMDYSPLACASVKRMAALFDPCISEVLHVRHVFHSYDFGVFACFSYSVIHVMAHLHMY